MVLVHDAVSSPKARGEAWIEFPPYCLRKIPQGTPAFSFADVSNVLIPKAQVHVQEREGGKTARKIL